MAEEKIMNEDEVIVVEKEGFFAKLKDKVSSIPSAVKYGAAGAAGAAAMVALGLVANAKERKRSDAGEGLELVIEDFPELTDVDAIEV